jgi:hypothetical protein
MTDPLSGRMRFDYGPIVDEAVAGTTAAVNKGNERVLTALEAAVGRILTGQQAGVSDVKQALRESEGRLTSEVRAVPEAVNTRFYRNNPNLQGAGNQNGGYQMPDHAPVGGGGKSGGYSLGTIIFWAIIVLVFCFLVRWTLTGSAPITWIGIQMPQTSTFGTTSTCVEPSIWDNPRKCPD